MRHNELSDKAAFAIEFLDLPAATGMEDATWEEFQLQFLNNQTRYGLHIKARQISWSWTAALDALVDSILNPGTPHVFNSINLNEAMEKIRYARQIAAAFDKPIRDKYFNWLQDTHTSLELSNHSRLISFPCRPPRGFAQMRWYGDEMAHWKNGIDRQIYTAALPATTKGGYLRIGSSPLGASGQFWEIATESTQVYPGYAGHRRAIPWWEIRAFCNSVPTARKEAPLLTTAARVYRFGTPAIVGIFENMFLEDFQQEYECAWVDEAVAWLSWDTIKANQDTDLTWWHASSVDSALQLIDIIQTAINNKEIESVFTVGIDIGRKRDLTEFMMLGKTTTGHYPLRFSVSLDRVPYDEQQECFFQLVQAFPIVSALIDQNGIGAQLAENLSRRTRVAEGVDFTNVSKELWAVEARIQAQRGNVPLPLDREIAYQIHSIKKTTTAAKNNVFDTEKNEKHHADKFWAWALAIWGNRERRTTRMVVV